MLPSLSIGQKYTLDFKKDASCLLALVEGVQQGRPLLIITADSLEALKLTEQLAFFLPNKRITFLPDWEMLPYEQFSPHPDLISERLATLWAWCNGAFEIGIVALSTALMPVPSRSFLKKHHFFAKVGQQLLPQKWIQNLVEGGYLAVDQVRVAGEFCLRGGLLDVFPMGSPRPYRLDFFDETLESIRYFDPDTQRSAEALSSISLLPAREYPLDSAGLAIFEANFQSVFSTPPDRAFLQTLQQGHAPAGIEFYLPLFFEEKTRSTFSDFLPDNTICCFYGDLDQSAKRFHQEVEQRYTFASASTSRPLLPPKVFFQSGEQFFIQMKPFSRFQFQLSPSALPDVSIQRNTSHPIEKLNDFLNRFSGRTLILAESLGRREIMDSFFSQQGCAFAKVDTWSAFMTASDPVMLGFAPLDEGGIACLPWGEVAIFTERELYQTQTSSNRLSRRKPPQTTSETFFKHLAELNTHDPVVHEQHGVGRYLGLVTLDHGAGETEYLHLEYAGQDKLYIPVSQLHLLSRYSGGHPDHAPLHQLGSGQWEKAQRKAREAAQDAAAELLNLYALRALRTGTALTLHRHEYLNFCEGFGFEETPDQAAAIEAVLMDMQAPKPMDRLVCGDVGFGKTEVALRAAFIAVMNGLQVALLVPTTLLAEQHYRKLCDRFANWPVKIAELSRFRSGKEQTATLAGLANGTIDIVVGTHKLVQPDIVFKRLGLVIIDEEHRFGVRQKERLKALRAEVDILTLTATPIPRTLGMALEGLRDFSVIATAPHRRLAIKTFVNRFDSGLIREAVHRELRRGGQVFFLYNEVETISNMEARLQEMLPNVRIAVAHGQMRERELEQVMRDFYQLRAHILLCSTIIETGIDLPNANTIIIHRADKFGLAQLHQLRGRVGRSHHQAYAYLLTPEESALTPAAKKRLEAIQKMEELGAGVQLAMHDLEIRGAGEILGESQSGLVQEIGFELFNRMLNQTVKALKSGETLDLNAPLSSTIDIRLHAPALLPERYCPDVHERLVLYKRFSSAANENELNALHVELIDRFGLLPEPAQTLLSVHQLRLQCEPCGIIKLDSAETQTLLQFKPNPPIDPMQVIQLIQKDPRYKLIGSDKLKFTSSFALTLPQRLQQLEALFSFLKGAVSSC